MASLAEELWNDLRLGVAISFSCSTILIRKFEVAFIQQPHDGGAVALGFNPVMKCKRLQVIVRLHLLMQIQMPQIVNMNAACLHKMRIASQDRLQVY
jgi:hypothetical protein